MTALDFLKDILKFSAFSAAVIAASVWAHQLLEFWT